MDRQPEIIRLAADHEIERIDGERLTPGLGRFVLTVAVWLIRMPRYLFVLTLNLCGHGSEMII